MMNDFPGCCFCTLPLVLQESNGEVLRVPVLNKKMTMAGELEVTGSVSGAAHAQAAQVGGWVGGWVGWLVGWVGGWVVCWFGWSVGWLVGWLIVSLAGPATSYQQQAAACCDSC